ncbi:gp19.3 [Erwinia phage vB_EamP-L1]|uniref:Gp19.3 n=1 Tax=Erwinia phage vB_EamP-L1 TaxID=1051673 RepID=G0YQ91_9CAUD|nr:gp19.3 [Erwinia phage vB_EamP-L1]AEJ81518.1 gp19.3 [Erwinia phage vB_EamP-L1]
MDTPSRPLRSWLRRPSNGTCRQLSSRVTSVTVCSVKSSSLFS